MRPPPDAISAASSGAVSGSAATAGAGSQSADSQRRTRRSSSGPSVSAKPSQTTAMLRAVALLHRHCPDGPADPFGAGETPALPVPMPRRELRPAVAHDRQAQVDRPGNESMFSPARFAFSPLSGHRVLPGVGERVERPLGAAHCPLRQGRGCLRGAFRSTHALSSAWRRSARMSSSCSMPIDRRT